MAHETWPAFSQIIAIGGNPDCKKGQKSLHKSKKQDS
jgi:hypothetical protein